MVKRVTLWRPDTHPDTVIELEWDDEVPEDQRTHEAKTVCVKGVACANPKADFVRILNENRCKNEAVAIVSEVVGDPEVVNNLPSQVKEDGVVEIIGDPLDKSVKDKANARLDERFFGLARVV